MFALFRANTFYLHLRGDSLINKYNAALNRPFLNRCLCSTRLLPRNVLNTNPLLLHYRKKKIDPRYADDEEDARIAEVKVQAILERKKLKKNNLLATHIAHMLSTNTMTIFVHGNLSTTQIKGELTYIGLKSMRIKSKLIKIAAQ